MIALGLRLTLRGGREAGARLVFTAFGVAVAVALLLLLLAGFNGLSAQDARAGWLSTNQTNRVPSVNEATSTPILWQVGSDIFGTADVTRVDVAATGDHSPVPPGIPRLPGPGEYYVSPALARLMASTPRVQLADRFPGCLVGEIGNAGLVSPDSLIVIVGHTAADLRGWGTAFTTRSIEAAPRQHGYSDLMRVILGLGAIGLMIPILVFVATATRLAAARREERFAALRLVGATPVQVAVLASIEAGVASVAGMAAGFGFFWACRPLVALIPFKGVRFFTGDLSLGWLAIVAVAAGVPAAAVLASLTSLRRGVISPLGVTRRETPRVNLPFQVIETVNESRATREVRRTGGTQGGLFDVYEGTEGQTFEEGWRNKLIWGDNLLVMGSLLERFAGKIDLIYIDPPFATGADFSFSAEIGDSGEEILKEQSAVEERAYRDTWGRGTDSYLAMLFVRLTIMRDLLASSGSIYIHIGPNINHLVRGLADEVFGGDRHLNEIVWRRAFAHSDSRRCGIIHDAILLYSRSDTWTWNEIRQKPSI